VDLKWDDSAKTLHYALARGGVLPAKEILVSLQGGETRRILPQRRVQTVQL